MASRFMRLFFDTDKLAETNRKFRERMAEIDAQDAEVKTAIKNAHAANKAAFVATINANTAKRNAKLKQIDKEYA